MAAIDPNSFVPLRDYVDMRFDDVEDKVNDVKDQMKQRFDGMDTNFDRLFSRVNQLTATTAERGGGLILLRIIVPIVVSLGSIGVAIFAIAHH